MGLNSEVRKEFATGQALRVGLIGCGKMGMHHLRAIADIPRASVVGVADPLVTREALGSLIPADAIVTADVEEILAVRPDVIHIVTPPETHTDLAIRALRAGCNVYLEKPFTPTRAQAAAVLNLAAERGLMAIAGHQYLFERPALLAAQTMDRIGRLVHVESYFSFRMVRRTISPADQARDILPHAVYPLVHQMRMGTGLPSGTIELKGLDVRPSGDVYALLRLGDSTGVLLVTLSGRPIEQYQHLVGTNGWMRADYVTGGVVTMSGPGTGPGILLTPFRRSWQTLTGATRGCGRLLTGHTSYPGLGALIDRFYSAVAQIGQIPITPQSILDTVGICERIGEALEEEERRAESAARVGVMAQQEALPPVPPQAPHVLVTGGTGLLGKRVAEELRHAGMSVRVLARRKPRWSVRLPGVEYVVGDLARPLDPAIMAGITVVAHCAAETAGGKDDHERNSIAGTRNVIEASAAAAVQLIVHISSLAVLKPGSSPAHPLSESSPVDTANLERGPYVWGKAESEVLAQRLAAEHGLAIRVIRPGPLVDYSSFHPPGRLGRELGPWFVAIGGRRLPLSVCDVGTAARVIRSYVQRPDTAPPMMNLVEAPPPTRGELAARVRADQPDLRFLWVPAWLLRALSPLLKLAQRMLMHTDKPIDVYSAFASEHYQTELAARVIAHAGPSSVRTGRPDGVHA
jgi:predicted dehydrogenase/nucleoside-diphosphate-sugar epimerase